MPTNTKTYVCTAADRIVPLQERHSEDEIEPLSILAPQAANPPVVFPSIAAPCRVLRLWNQLGSDVQSEHRATDYKVERLHKWNGRLRDCEEIYLRIKLGSRDRFHVCIEEVSSARRSTVGHDSDIEQLEATLQRGNIVAQPVSTIPAITGEVGMKMWLPYVHEELRLGDLKVR